MLIEFNIRLEPEFCPLKWEVTPLNPRETASETTKKISKELITKTSNGLDLVIEDSNKGLDKRL